MKSHQSNSINFNHQLTLEVTHFAIFNTFCTVVMHIHMDSTIAKIIFTIYDGCLEVAKQVLRAILLVLQVILLVLLTCNESLFNMQLKY